MTMEQCNEGRTLLDLYLLHQRPIREAEVGDEVDVVDRGQVFTGKVQAKLQDGRLQVSFAGRRPSRDTFAINELKPKKTSPTVGGATTPATPTIRPALTPTTVVGAR